MKLSKLEILLIVVAFFVGMHFYTEYKLGRDEPVPGAVEGIADSVLFSEEKTPIVVAFGDSLTAGVGAGKEQSWPARLSQLLGIEIINEGKPGETTNEGIWRLEQVLKQYKPDVIFIEEGANDLINGRKHTKIAQNLIKMVKMAKESGAKPILIGFPNPDLLDLMLTSDLEIYEKVAKRAKVYYIPDVFGPVLRKEEYKSDDFVHPNAEGYREVARRIYNYLVEHPI